MSTLFCYHFFYINVIGRFSLADACKSVSNLVGQRLIEITLIVYTTGLRQNITLKKLRSLKRLEKVNTEKKYNNGLLLSGKQKSIHCRLLKSLIGRIFSVSKNFY